MQRFSHLIIGVVDELVPSDTAPGRLEPSNVAYGELIPYQSTHEVLAVIYGYSCLRLTFKSIPLKIVTEPKIYVLKRARET